MSNQPNCALCESNIDVQKYSLQDRFVANPDAPEHRQRTDWVAVRRKLAEEHGLETTVSNAKEHTYEHVMFTMADSENTND